MYRRYGKLIIKLLWDEELEGFFLIFILYCIAIIVLLCVP